MERHYKKSKFKFFLNPQDLNVTSNFKDIFINPAEDTHKKTPGREKVLTLKKNSKPETSSNFEKPFRILIPFKF